jgi:tetratricopeptide (TPR) repeat protein
VTAAFVSLLFAATVVSAWQAVRAWRAEEAALTARDAEAEQRQLAENAERVARAAAEAERRAKETAVAREAETRAMVDFVETQIFAAAKPEGQAGGLGREVTLRRVIDAALAKLDKSFPGQPIIEARLRVTLGQTYFELGEMKIAAEQFQVARVLFSKHLGPDHPYTLVSMNSLALSYANLGRYTEALKLREETLALRRTKLGPDNLYTLQSMDNLANSYGHFGRHAEALKLHEESLRLRKAKFGPDHPATVFTMHAMAGCYNALGRHADALRLFEELLPLRKSQLGPRHYYTLRSMGGLAHTYATLGRDAEALKLHEEILALRKTQLGPDHPDTLQSMYSLANSYAALGRDAEALKLHEETLTLRKAKEGPDHPHTLNSRNGLAWFLTTASDASLRNPSRAVELAARAAELAPTEPDYRGTLGTARYRSGDWKGAVADLEKAVGLRNPDNPNNARDGFFLAMAHWQLGEKEEARSWFDKSVRWMAGGLQDNAELKRFRAEAAQLLGIEPMK